MSDKLYSVRRQTLEGTKEKEAFGRKVQEVQYLKTGPIEILGKDLTWEEAKAMRKLYYRSYIV